MFTIDERYRGLPTPRDEVRALYQSINAPHLAIPGKQAGPAHAFILGRQGPAGSGVLVYLFLPESADCAVYASGRRHVSPEQYPDEESEALAFVESMGFMMDNVNFGSLTRAQQEELQRTLPVFQADPRRVQGVGVRSREDERSRAAAQLGRLLAAF